MLQEKKNKFPVWCIKLAIFIAGLFLVFYSGFIFILIVFLVFFSKGSGEKTYFDFWQLSRFIWFDECVKYILKKMNLEDNRSDKEKIADYRKKLDSIRNREIIFDEIIENKEKYKNVEDIYKKTKKDKIKKYQKDKSLDYEKIFSERNMEKRNKIKDIKKKNMSSEGFSPLKSKNWFNSKWNKSGFNSWKSIWDEYESVLDIMKKNK